MGFPTVRAADGIIGGPGGYITLAAWGVPTASERRAESKVAHKWARWLHNPCRLRGSPPLHSRWQNQRWPTSGQGGYITLAAWGVPTASARGAEAGVANKWARWLHNPRRLGGSKAVHSRGQNKRWPTSGQGGYIILAAWGVSHRFTAACRITSGPQVGKVATEPLPLGGSPLLQRGGQNHRWPTTGQRGYINLAASGVPTALERREN